MGSVTELLDDLKKMNENEVCTLFELRKNGLEKLRARLGDEKIGYTENGSYELISEKEIDALDKIDYLNKLLQPITKKSAFILANSKIKEFGFSVEYTKALISNNCEGAIDTGKMMRAFTDLALQTGIEIKSGAEVLNFEENDKEVIVIARNIAGNESINFKCKTVAFCTNAFTKHFFPEEDITPGRGQVLITQPIKGLSFQGIFILMKVIIISERFTEEFSLAEVEILILKKRKAQALN